MRTKYGNKKMQKNTENIWKNSGDNTEYESKDFFYLELQNKPMT